MMNDPRFDPDCDTTADMRPASWWFVLSTLWGRGYYEMLANSVSLRNLSAYYVRREAGK